MRFANTDKSPFQPGEYVGIAEDDVGFRIYRDVSSSTWWAMERDGPSSQQRRVLSDMHLSDLSIKLAIAASV